MWHESPELVDGAAEAVPDVNAVRLPSDPVEGGVVPASVRAELQATGLSQGVMRVIDAHECCAQSSRSIIDNLIKRQDKYILFLQRKAYHITIYFL